jgi:hypothetical protein
MAFQNMHYLSHSGATSFLDRRWPETESGRGRPSTMWFFTAAVGRFAAVRSRAFGMILHNAVRDLVAMRSQRARNARLQPYVRDGRDTR